MSRDNPGSGPGQATFLPRCGNIASFAASSISALNACLSLSASARTAAGRLAAPGDLVSRAHALGLQVVPWTFRPEQPYLPAGLPISGEGLRQEAAAVAEMQAYLATGIDGLMTDDPALGVRALQAPAAR